MKRNLFFHVIALLLAVQAPGIASASCAGDCGDDGQVTVDEVVLGVNIALGVVSLSQCGNMDADGDGSVTVNEIITALSAALNGCSISTPAATSTATATATESATTPTAGPGNGLFISNAPPEAGTTFQHRSTITPNPVAVVVPGVFANITWNEFSDPVSVGSFHGGVNETLSVSINLTNGQLTNSLYGVTSIAAVGSPNLPPSSYGTSIVCPPPNYCSASARGLQVDAVARTATFTNFEMPRLNNQGVTERVVVNGTIRF